MNILSHLSIDENTYNNLVIDFGVAYARANQINPTASFWINWWRSWLEADEAEIETTPPRCGHLETYITSQLMAYTITNK